MSDADVSLALNRSERNLSLRIFIDPSVLEVFANETLCATKVISPLDANATLEIPGRRRHRACETDPILAHKINLVIGFSSRGPWLAGLPAPEHLP